MPPFNFVNKKSPRHIPFNRDESRGLPRYHPFWPNWPTQQKVQHIKLVFAKLKSDLQNKKLLIPCRDEKLYLALPPNLSQKGHSTKVRELISDTPFLLTVKNRPSLLDFVQPAAREGTSSITTHRRVYSRDSSSLKGNT